MTAPAAPGLVRARVQAGARSGAVVMRRQQLQCSLDPTAVLAKLRGRSRLVGLIGAWAGGGAIIACDPIARSTRLSDVRAVPLETDRAGDMIGAAWIGVLGYQHGARLETLPHPPMRPQPKPDCDFAFYDHLLRYERDSGTWWFESAATPDRHAHIDRALRRLTYQLSDVGHADPQPYQCGGFTMVPTPAGHRRAVAAAIDAIHAGDIFQTNLAVRLEADFKGDPLDVFVRGVEALHPDYAAFVSSEHGAIASLSPELFLRRSGRTVRTSPIKGTAPLSVNAEQLLASHKDSAENVMIVDLMRNDLGRVSVAGSVRVPHAARVEKHTGVWHLVTDVTSTLHDDVTDIDLLRATFPPGSVTGAPKVSAMEYINHLETTGREAYTGAIGLISGPLLELNVAIRTFEFGTDRIWLGVGGGVVADSTPDGELAECLTKARPLIAAVGATLADTTPPESRRRRRIRRPRSREPLPRLFDTLPIIIVDDEGLRIDRGHTEPVVSPGLTKILTALGRCHLPVTQTSLTAHDLRCAAESFAVSPDGTVVGVRVDSRLVARPTDEPGPLTRWLAGLDYSDHVGVSTAPQAGVPQPQRGPGGSEDLSVLLIDNYDSFVFNLSRYCEELGASTEVVRNDPSNLAALVTDIDNGTFQRIIISPGPGRPADAGLSVPLVRAIAGTVPVLGVCLGHQAIGEAFGARIVRSARPVHGQRTLVHHDSAGIYRSLSGPFTAARYHSLVIDEHTMPEALIATARTPSGLLMGVRHREFDIEGIQVHPESLLTPAGHHLLDAFLRGSGTLAAERTQPAS